MRRISRIRRTRTSASPCPCLKDEISPVIPPGLGSRDSFPSVTSAGFYARLPGRSTLPVKSRFSHERYLADSFFDCLEICTRPVSEVCPDGLREIGELVE